LMVVGYADVRFNGVHMVDTQLLREAILTVKVGFSTAELVTDSTTLSTLLVASSAAEETEEAASSTSSATSARAMAA
jgi:hypothetical protein